ncbi:hypothetical protein [Stutzerimonas nitrititolerans]|uniref:hypothetical protein n=1 Tax=Stutzerimonas nitrititolerans TaxID=2482751 RepID=UPI0028A80640|nr:hypothetical protein [Stutzerimonas nitrititolerans]
MSKEVNWQAECLKKGFEYVREPDDHYVIADPSEMVALLRDLLGVDVRTKEGDSYGVAVSELQEQIDGLVNTLHAQHAERDALLAERDAARMRVKELDLLFGRYLLAMKAAVIDADQRGDEEGMRWIYNSLEGPGELPAEEEMDAQAFFDREIKPINDAMAELFAALQGEQP